MAARQERKIGTITLLTTMLDFSDTGEIGLLIDWRHDPELRGAPLR